MQKNKLSNNDIERETKTREYKLKYSHAITAWDEAIPLGNGDLGCLIWGKSNELRFSLDKSGIWDCSNPPEEQDGFTYANLIDLVSRRKQRKINKIFDDCYANTTPTKLPTGRIILDFGQNSEVSSELDILTAEAKVAIDKIAVRSFVHAVEDYGLIEINTANVDLRLEAPKYGIKGKKTRKRFAKGISQSLSNLRYDEVEYHSIYVGEIIYDYFIQPTNDGAYGIFTARLVTSDKTLIAYTVVSAEKGDKLFDIASSILNKALAVEYAESFKNHLNWWSEYHSKSEINLEDKTLEYQWYLNNYLLGSCSRKGKLPMPLQGVWTADNGDLPPWKGDYHHDLNTQMSYTSYLKANRLNEGESFIDYLLNMSNAGERFAKKYYGVDGLCLPSVMDVQGHALGGWAQYALSPTNQLWLCLIMSRHYHFTGNKDYFNQIYPYFIKVGAMILGLLKKVDGYYRLPLSSSPEINDNRLSSWLTPNSNYDLALIRAFMAELATLSGIAGDESNKTEWLNHLEKMEKLAIDDRKVLKISKDKTLDVSHRHLSHCMAIYPLRTMRYVGENKDIIDKTIADIERLSKKYWVGYTYGWLANLHVIQQNGDKAYKLIKDFFSYFCTANGFHVNGDFTDKTDCGMKYRYFTLEGNFLATDAINNMLLYSECDGTVLFPAIPKNWRNLSFKNLRGYGGILVSAELSDGKVSFLKIVAENDVSVKIMRDDKTESTLASEIMLKNGEEYVWRTVVDKSKS